MIHTFNLKKEKLPLIAIAFGYLFLYKHELYIRIEDRVNIDNTIMVLNLTRKDTMGIYYMQDVQLCDAVIKREDV
jgi:hypothetical protein